MDGAFPMRNVMLVNHLSFQNGPAVNNRNNQKNNYSNQMGKESLKHPFIHTPVFRWRQNNGILDEL